VTTSVEPHAPATAAEQFALRRQSPVQRIQHLLHSHPALSPLMVLVVALIVFTIINPRFAQPATLSIILQQTAVIAALAIGQTLIILTAGIDLAVGATAILSMLVMANLAATNGVPGPLALIIGIAVGTACGLLNGLLVTRLNLPPFIVTLGTLSIFTAIGLLYSGGASVGKAQMPAILNVMGTRFSIGPFNLTLGVIVVILLAVVMGFILSQTAWGRHVYAVGDDLEAARLVGIPVDRVLLSVYTVAGLIYGFTAWVMIGRAGTASPSAIVGANLETITAVVIGGTSLFGGRGGIIGTMLGALIVYSFNVGLALAGVDDQLRILTIGVLIIVAVSIDQWIRKVKA
jgi:fructose transport system permease protein